VRDVVERSLMQVTHKREKQNIEMDLNLTEGDEVIICDPALLQQACIAIIIDALKAMPHGGKLTFEYTASPPSIQGP
jgi:signal transduction histidine kinase